jgi:hypothetical protein
MIGDVTGATTCACTTGRVQHSDNAYAEAGDDGDDRRAEDGRSVTPIGQIGHVGWPSPDRVLKRIAG